MQETNHVQNNGIFTVSFETMGFITWIIFLILKVTGTWDIPWFWVWFPLWIPLAVGAAIFLLIIVAVLVVIAIDC